MQKLQNLLPLDVKSDLPSTFLILCQVIQKMFFTTPTIICAFNLNVPAITNLNYSSLSQKIVQKKYVKTTLATVNFGELAKDHLKKVKTTELKRVSRCKLRNKVDQKEKLLL